VARIAGVNIPDDKRIEIALTYIYGVGRNTSGKILDKLTINKNTRTKELSTADLEKIREEIEKNYKIEGDLRMDINQNIKRLKETGTWRGDRHIKKLPVYGQRTKTNARTKRGKRVTVGSGRKPTAEKT
jgi:small subunit ribosomal protein S13